MLVTSETTDGVDLTKPVGPDAVGDELVSLTTTRTITTIRTRTNDPQVKQRGRRAARRSGAGDRALWTGRALATFSRRGCRTAVLPVATRSGACGGLSAAGPWSTRPFVGLPLPGSASRPSFGPERVGRPPLGCLFSRRWAGSAGGSFPCRPPIGMASRRCRRPWVMCPRVPGTGFCQAPRGCGEAAALSVDQGHRRVPAPPWSRRTGAQRVTPRCCEVRVDRPARGPGSLPVCLTRAPRRPQQSHPVRGHPRFGRPPR